MPNNPTPSPAPEAPGRIYLQYFGSGYADDEPPQSVDDRDVTWCRDRIHKHDVEYVRADTRATAPAPASGWMERAADEWAPKGKIETPAIRAAFLAIIARHAPDVAKLEALQKHTLDNVRMWERANAKLETEVAELKFKWESDTPGKPGHIFRTTMRRIAELTGSKFSSRPGICFVEDMATKLTATEAENARLREALQNVLSENRSGANNCLTMAKIAYEALAASPAPSAWREIDCGDWGAEPLPEPPAREEEISK